MTFYIETPGGKYIKYAKNRHHLIKQIKKQNWYRWYENKLKIVNITHLPLKKFELEYDYDEWFNDKHTSGHERKIMRARHWFEVINDFYNYKLPQRSIFNLKWKEIKL